jgi:hypothetical protein
LDYIRENSFKVYKEIYTTTVYGQIDNENRPNSENPGALKDSNNLSKSEAETVVTLFFNQMAEALAKGDRVEVRGLCSFFVIKY